MARTQDEKDETDEAVATHLRGQAFTWLATSQGVVLGFAVSLIGRQDDFTEAEKATLFVAIVGLALAFALAPLLLMTRAGVLRGYQGRKTLQNGVFGIVIAGMAVGVIALVVFAGSVLL